MTKITIVDTTIRTKQQEIREGLARIRPSFPWDELDEDDKEFHREWADEVLKYLASQGVVLKVEKDYPGCPYETSPEKSLEENDMESSKELGYLVGQDYLVRAGWSATEPLIDL